MDLFAGLFGFLLFVSSVVLTYQYGIKPDREHRKRKLEQALAELRRRDLERSRKRSTV